MADGTRQAAAAGQVGSAATDASRTATGATLAAGAHTEAEMLGLLEASGGIEQVVQLVGRIAEQTNMLALNAGATEEIFSLLGGLGYDGVLQDMLARARGVAAEVEAILTRLARSGEARLEGLQDWRYTEVKGPLIARLARLFDVRRVPQEGFRPPKFITS